MSPEEVKSPQSSHTEPRVKHELSESTDSKHGVKRRFTEFEEQRRQLSVDDEEPQRMERRKRTTLNDSTDFMPSLSPDPESSSEEDVFFFPRELWRFNIQSYSGIQVLTRYKLDLTVIQIAPSHTVSIRTERSLSSKTLSIKSTINSNALMLSQLRPSESGLKAAALSPT
jgi:hypothetical protein